MISPLIPPGCDLLADYDRRGIVWSADSNPLTRYTRVLLGAPNVRPMVKRMRLLTTHCIWVHSESSKDDATRRSVAAVGQRQKQNHHYFLVLILGNRILA